VKISAIVLACLIASPVVAATIHDEDSAIRVAIKTCRQIYPGTVTDVTKWIAAKRGSRWDVCEIVTGVTCSLGEGMHVSIGQNGKAGACRMIVTVR